MGMMRHPFSQYGLAEPQKWPGVQVGSLSPSSCEAMPDSFAAISSGAPVESAAAEHPINDPAVIVTNTTLFIDAPSNSRKCPRPVSCRDAYRFVTRPGGLAPTLIAQRTCGQCR